MRDPAGDSQSVTNDDDDAGRLAAAPPDDQSQPRDPRPARRPARDARVEQRLEHPEPRDDRRGTGSTSCRLSCSAKTTRARPPRRRRRELDEIGRIARRPRASLFGTPSATPGTPPGTPVHFPDPDVLPARGREERARALGHARDDVDQRLGAAVGGAAAAGAPQPRRPGPRRARDPRRGGERAAPRGSRPTVLRGEGELAVAALARRRAIRTPRRRGAPEPAPVADARGLGESLG